MNQKKLVFIIDDDVDSRNIIKLALKEHFFCMPINDATKALQLAVETRPYLILLDLAMPNIDGYEFLHQLKKHPFCFDIPVICISANNTEEARHKIQSLGALGLIKKPINPKSLRDAIDGMLQNTFTHLTDKSGKLNYYMQQNGQERDHMIIDICTKSIENETPVYLMTWRRPAYYIEEGNFKQFVQNNQLIFLQVKNQLAIRLPYLQDLSPVYADIRNFYQHSPQQSHLVVDDVKQLIGEDLYQSRGKVIRLIDYLAKDFKEVTLINTRSSNQNINKVLNHIAREFVQP